MKNMNNYVNAVLALLFSSTASGLDAGRQNGLRARLARWKAGSGRGLALAGLALLAGPAVATTTINHQFTAATIYPGDVSKYRITVTNDDTGSTLTNARVTSILQSQITVASPLNFTNTCGFTVNKPTVAGGSTIELVGGSIPVATAGVPSQCYFEVDVSSVVVGNWINTIPPNPITGGAPGTPTITPSATTTGYLATTTATGVLVANTTQADATLSVNSMLPPTGAKNYSPFPNATATNPVTLSVVLTNPNAAATMPLTTFTDVLPDDGSGHAMLVNGAGTVNCTGVGAVNGTVSVAGDNKSFTLNGSTIGNSGSCTITVPVRVATISGTSQSFNNTLASGAIGNTRGLTSPAFSRALTINTPISIQKSFSPNPIPVSQASLMTLTINNASTVNPLDISAFSDNLTGTTLQILTTTSVPVAAIADPVVTCTGVGAANGTLSYVADVVDTTISLADAIAGPGGACSIQVYVTSYVDGVHNNTTSKVTNPASNHDSSPASASLTAKGQLLVQKSVSINQVAPGQWTEFTVTIQNFTGTQVNNVFFKDQLPSSGANQMVVYDPAGTTTGIYTTTAGCIGGTWTGLNAGGADTTAAPVSGVDTGLQWTGGSIVAGSGSTPGVCTIKIRTQLPASATSGLSFTNSIPLNSVTGDRQDNGNPVTNPDTNPSANVVSVDSVAVSKGFSPGSIPQGATSTLTINVYNRIVSPVTGINLTDSLPVGLKLAANPAPTNSCNGSLQAFPGDTQIILTGGSINARPDAQKEAICSITVKVTGSTVGSFTNIIPPANFTSSGGTISGNASAGLTITTGIIASKAFAPTAVSPGGKSRVSINITNSSSAQLTNLSVDDDAFGAGLTVANPANAATSCSGSPTLVVNPGAARAQMLGGKVNAGATCTFSFDVETSGAGPWSNTVPAGKITTAEGPSNTTAASANLGVNSASISINKSFATPVVTGGVPSVLQIDVSNNSSITIHNAGFTDTFPTGIQVYSAPATSTNCAGGTVSAVPGDGKVVLSGATLMPNATCQVFVTTTSIKFLNLTNTIPALSVTSFESYTNPLATSASLSTLQGLGVMKAFAPTHIISNGISRLRVTLISTFDPNAVAPTTLTGVSFTDTMPAGVTVAATPNPSTTCSDGAGGFATVTSTASAMTLSGATIPPGSLCQIEIDVTAATIAAYDNTIGINAVSSTQGVTNQTAATARLSVVTLPTISKAFAASSVQIGQATRLTVTINNGSGAALSGLALSDTLPAGLAIAGSPNVGTTCSNGLATAAAGDDVLSIAGASLAVGQSCTFYADVLSNTAGTYLNNIPAGGLVSDQGLSNPAPANASLVVLPPASVTKKFAPASISSGGISTLTITLANSSASPITLISALVDALPGNVFVHSTPNLGGTCTGTKTAVANGTTITYASGSAIPPGSCTITVDVTSSLSGSYVNVIAAGQLHTSAGDNQDPAIATLGVDTLASPTIDKNFAPSTILAGDTSTLTITLGNDNATDLTLTAPFTDTMPANVTIQGTPVTSCTNTVLGFDANSVTLPSATRIPAGAGCTITATVTSVVAGSYTNTIAATDLVTDGGSPPSPASAGLVVNTLTPPTVVKSFNPSTINPGTNSLLTITLGNENASNVTLSADMIDTLPANVLVAGTPAIGGTCSNGNGGAPWGAISTGANTITYASGAIIPPGGCTITVNVSSSVAGGPYTNTIAAGNLQTNAGNNGAAATANLFVNPPQPPSISKSFVPALIPRSGTSTLSISLGNGNAAPTTLNADLVDTLPAGVVVAALPNVQKTCPGTVTTTSNTITYASGSTLPAGGCAINVDVTAATAGTYVNTIGTNALDTGYGKNAVGTSASLQVINWPTNTDLSLTKTLSVPTGAAAGTTETVTLTWRNTNAANPTLRMYQCVISDPLPTTAFDETTALEGSTPAGYTYSRSGNTVTYTRTDTTTPCETTLQTATFTVKLKAGVVVGSTYTNTATATAKTLPSNDPNVAAATTLTKTASATVAVTAPTTSTKTVVSTSQNFTDPSDTNKNANPAVAVGETITYSIPFNLPPGVTSAVTLADEITTGIGDVALVAATLARSSTNLSAANDLASINAAAVNTPVDVTASSTISGNELRFVLGNVTNSDVASASYTLTVTVRVQNVAANVAGHTITDQGRFRYQDATPTAQTVTTATKSVHVALPIVAISKSVAPAAPAGGDTVTYTLTITNTSGANSTNGYDWTFTDVLPAELTSPGGFTVTANAGAHVVAGSFTGNTLSGSIDQLNPGQSVTVQYTAVVASSTAFGKTITNGATARATTIPASSPDEVSERSGAGGVNNLSATTSASVTTSKPTMTKAVVSPQSFYAIGDLVHYRITVAAPAGTTSNFAITDALPAGLSYVTGSAVISTTGGVTAPAAGAITPSAVSPLTLAIGTITAPTAGSVIVDFDAQVTNLRTNQNNTSLTNTANATYDNPAGGASLTLSASAAAIKVGEPNLVMTKTIVSGATGSVAASTVRWQFTVANTGTTTAYQQNIIDVLPNHLNGIALVSVTPSGGNIQNNNAGCASGSAVGLADGAVSTTTNSNDTLTFANICMAPGTTLTVQYDSTVMNTAVAAEVLTNSVRSSYVSQPAGTSGTAVVRDGVDAGTDDDTDPASGTCDGSTVKCNNYNESASGALTIGAPIAIDKLADKSTATVGENVTYTIKVSVIEGVTPAVVVRDVLPAGLSYVSHTISLGHVGMTLGNVGYNTRQGTGQTVQFTLGDIGNDANGNAADDYVSVDITARVDNIVANQKGTILRNGEGTGGGQTTPTVTVAYGAGPTTIGYDFNTGVAGYQGRPLTVTEPKLTLTKTAAPVAQSLGDEVTFTLTIQHDGANSDATAFDLLVSDTLPAGLTYMANSSAPTEPSVAGQVLTFPTIASLTTASGSTVITYRARVDLASAVGTALINNARVSWSSLSGATGAATSGRTGPLNGGDTLNDYTTTAAASVTPTASAFIQAQKTVAILTDGGTAGIADPGDTLRYTVTLTNTGSSTANHVVFDDAMPANTTYAGNLNTSAGSGVTVGSAPVLGVSVDVGDLLAGATVTIRFDVTIDAGTPVGTIISNQGSVDSDQTVPKPTDEDGNPSNGDQPTTIPVGGAGPGALYASKFVSLRTDADTSSSITAGDTMRYALIVRNTGGTALANVVLSDPIPSGLSATGTPGATQGSIGVAAGTVTWTIGTLAAGQVETAYFDVSINAFVGLTKTFSNQGTVSADTLAPIQTDGNGSPIDGAQPTDFEAVGSGTPAPKLDVQKRWSLEVDADGNGVASHNDSLRYTITVTNSGSIAATDVRLSDPAPSCAPTAAPCTTYVAGSASTSVGAVVSEGPTLQVNFGTLNPGQTAIVSLRVKADAANGNVVANQATVSAANVAGSVLSDDDGAVGNGRNPTLTPLAAGSTGSAAPNNLAKSLFATDQAGSSGSNLLIGEVATWRISIDVPAGTTKSLSLRDTLPADLELVAGSARIARTFSTGLTATANPGNVNGTASATFTALGGALQTAANPDGSTALSLDFGNVINSAATSASYTLEYQARVANVAANVQGRTRTNSASAGFLNALDQPVTLTPVSSTVTIIEAQVGVTLANSPASLLPSGGSVNYTSTLTNSSATAPAYDVTLAIPLPAVFTSAASLVVSSPGNCASGVSSTITGTPPTIDVSIGTMSPGCVATVTFTGNTSNALAAGSTISATATTRWTSLPGADAQSGTASGERTGNGTPPNSYVGQAVADITVNDLNLVKELVSSATRYAIGDTVTYRLRLSVAGPFGPVPNVQLSDVLPAGLVYTAGSSSVVIPAGVTSSLNPTALTGTGLAGDPLVLNLGSLQNSTAGGLDVVVTFDARVANVLINQDGTTWLNHATLTFNDPSSNLPVTPRDTPPVSITVGEPNLMPTLAPVTPTSGLNAGATVTYEYIGTNNGSTIMHGLVLSNTLPVGLGNVQGLTVVGVNDVNPAGDATPAVGITLSGTGTAAWNSTPFDLGIGDSVTIRYTVTLTNAAQPGQALQNTVIGTFTSRAGTDANERTGTPSGPIETDNGQLDNYRADAASPTLTVGDPVSFDKAFNPLGKTQYPVGEAVSYRLTVGLPQGTVRSLVVTDILPVGLDLVSAHVAGFGNGGITVSGSATPATASNGGQTQITWTLGDVVNPANGSTADDFITFDIDARVANTLANQAGVTLGNNASMSFLDGANQPVTRDFDADTGTPGIQPLDLTIVEPDLAFTKSANVATMSLGDEVRFSLLVDHLPSSGSDAFDVMAVDVLPIGLQYVAGSGSIAPTVSVLGDGRQQLVFAIGTLSKATDNTTILYRTKVQTNAAVGVPLTNNATLTWASLSGATGAANSGRTGTDGLPGASVLNDYRAQSATSVLPNTNAIYTTKVVALAVDLARPGVVDAGDTLEYTVVLNNGATPVTNVVFTDPIPVNTTYVANSLTLGAAPVTNAGSNTLLAVNVGSLAANATATITFRVTVNAGVVSGAIISNQGSVDSDQTVPKPTDSDFNPNNGDQPTDIPVGPAQPPSLSAVKTVALSNDRFAPVGVITAGDAITYTIVLTNNGTVGLTNVSFADVVPDNLSVTGVSANAVWTSGQNVTASFPSLAPGASVTITITADVGVAGVYSNQGDIGSAETVPGKTDDDGIPGNGINPTVFTAVSLGTVSGFPNLSVSKSAKVIQQIQPDGLLHPNDALQYDLVITNTGAAAATGVVLHDAIPAGTTFIQVASSQGSVTATQPDLLVNIGTMAPGAVVTVTLQVRVNAPIGSTVTNVADVACVETTGCPATSNIVNTPVVAPNVFDPPSGFKSVSPAGGSVLEWRMVWINSGNAVANKVRVIDPLSAKLTYIAGSVTCTARGSSTVEICDYDPVTHQVIYEGAIAADFNKLTEAAAANEVVITFRTTLASGTPKVSNTAIANWDRNGNGQVVDDVDAGQISISAATEYVRPVGIPALSEWALLLLALLMSAAALHQRRRQR